MSVFNKTTDKVWTSLWYAVYKPCKEHIDDQGELLVVNMGLENKVWNTLWGSQQLAITETLKQHNFSNKPTKQHDHSNSI